MLAADGSRSGFPKRWQIARLGPILVSWGERGAILKFRVIFCENCETDTK